MTPCPWCGAPIIHTGTRRRNRPHTLDAHPRAVSVGYIYQPDGDILTPRQIIDRTPGYRKHLCPPADQPQLYDDVIA